MKLKKWKGLQPPALGAAPKSPSGKSGIRSPIGKGSGASSPIGQFQIGRKSRSKKVTEIFG